MLATSEDLKTRWDDLKAEDPHAYIRNAAATLGVSEMELLGTRMGDGVVLLKPDFKGILTDVMGLGQVTAITRNDHAVHERTGVYQNASFEQGPVGLFLGKDIDLRIFWGQWANAFAVEESGRETPRISIQFFGHDGLALHKVYLTETSDRKAYDALVNTHRAAEQIAPVPTRLAAENRPEMPDSAVDIEAFRSGWLGLKDTHDFHMLLRDHRVGRTQALRLAPEGNYAVRLATSALRGMLNKAAEGKVPIMAFVGNPGMLQIHSGAIENVVDARGWLNVLDPLFNLHLREEAITEMWVVRKPTVDGMVTALECFDAEGSQVVQFFGARKPGIPELESWRELIGAIEVECRA